MKLSNAQKLFLALSSCAALAACSATSSSSGPTCSPPPVTNVVPLVTGQTPVNQIAVTVNGAECTGSQYFNEPCVSVQICTPGNHTQCQTIHNLLLDTGSYGLRIFKQVISVPLTQVMSASGHPLVDCAAFGDGSTDWGPVQYADVQIGGEPIISNLPIQVIDSTFPGSGNCGAAPDTGPCQAYFSGILGVGLNAYDTTSNYYSCNGSSCSTVATTCAGGVNAGVECTSNADCPGSTCPTDTTKVLANPITKIPISPSANMALADNNGSILELPDITGFTTGVASSNGVLVLGIDTENATASMTSNASSNAAPSPGTGATHAPVKFAVNPSGLTIQVSYKGVQTACKSGSGTASNCAQDTGVAPNNTGTDYSGAGIIDSGSNGLYYHDPNVPCAGTSSFYCPLAALSLTATNAGYLGTNPTASAFSIGNSGSLLNSGHPVFYNIGADAGPGGEFDWGLPFFFGRNVYVGIKGQSSTGFGAGPYLGY